MDSHHEKKESHHHESKKNSKMKIKKTMIWQVVCLALAIALAVVLYRGNDCASVGGAVVLTEEQASQKAIEFVNSNLVSPGTEAEVLNTSSENGLYKVVIAVQGQTVDSYITQDAKLFFPSGLDIVEMEAQKEAAEEQAEEEAESVPKTDKPSVELFVMSHCPFGTQIEKGIIPVADLLGDKIDLDVKFVNYAMHGEKELKEQLNQVCIQRDSSDKYIDYLKCFLEEGDGASCIASTGIDSDELASCVTEIDEEFSVMEKFKDPEKPDWRGSFPPFEVHDEENKKYGVRGSPHMVVNGITVSASRDAASLLDAVCNAFSEKPAECDTELSSASPAPGFGYEGTGSDTAATCG